MYMYLKKMKDSETLYITSHLATYYTLQLFASVTKTQIVDTYTHIHTVLGGIVFGDRFLAISITVRQSLDQSRYNWNVCD